jgi:hypothetical protein
MNGYVEAGYLICFGTLGAYSLSLVTRERAARRRLPQRPGSPDDQASPTEPASPR